MKKLWLFSALLAAGLIGSQFIADRTEEWIKIGTMFCMSFIMIQVGYELELDKSKPKEYVWDFFIAVTAASLPWIFCTLYFVWVMEMHSWQDALLLARFASPTSAGILLSMLIAAGLATTWVFRKVRLIAVFDDIDTILMMVPIKIIVFGMKWQFGVILFLVILLLSLSWRYLHQWRLPVTYPWIMLYSVIITIICEIIYVSSKLVDDVVPVNLEVLLPAFALGCLLARPKDHQNVSKKHREQLISDSIIAIFMVLAGLSMPVLPLRGLNLSVLAFHVLLITFLCNLGKMFPLFCYRDQASFRERLALSIGLFPRGEAATRKLVLSVGYGIGGFALTVSAWSIALNLILTGVFIILIKKLIGEKKKAF